MPVLAPGGPDLPIELLESHAAGELVIFAGAGISVPAGFPDFKDLVKGVYEALGEDFEGEERRLFRRGEYDRVLGLLEDGRRIGNPARRAVVGQLRREPKKGATVHSSILAIAKAGNGRRIVTTNFDRLFLDAGCPPGDVAVGPHLPVPRKPQWSGLVHLHGLLDSDGGDGLNLILTSADFGRAYLLDRWASRFEV